MAPLHDIDARGLRAAVASHLFEFVRESQLTPSAARITTMHAGHGNVNGHDYISTAIGLLLLVTVEPLD